MNIHTCKREIIRFIRYIRNINKKKIKSTKKWTAVSNEKDDSINQK